MARAGKTGKQNAILNIAQAHTAAQLRNLFKHFWDKMDNAKDRELIRAGLDVK